MVHRVADEADTGVLLIVKEAQAEWPLWVSEMQQNAVNSVVEAQGEMEGAADFALRVAKRARELRDRPIRGAVVLCADTKEPSVIDSRCWISRVIVSVLARDGHTEFLLAGAPQWSADSRTTLFSLAGVLCEELYGRDISVRVRFSFTGESSGPQPMVYQRAREKLASAS